MKPAKVVTPETPETIELRDEKGNFLPEVQAIIDQQVKLALDQIFSQKTLFQFCAENYRNIWGTVRFGAQFGKRIAVFFSGKDPYPKVWQLNPHINTLNVPHAIYLNPSDFTSADDLLQYLTQKLGAFEAVSIDESDLVDVQQ